MLTNLVFEFRPYSQFEDNQIAEAKSNESFYENQKSAS